MVVQEIGIHPTRMSAETPKTQAGWFSSVETLVRELTDLLHPFSFRKSVFRFSNQKRIGLPLAAQLTARAVSANE